MALHKITKGLDLPISGDPEQKVAGAPKVTRVAVLADDFPGMKPRMAVKEGDPVKRGQLLFENRKSEGVRHTAPGAGTVVAVNRGARRALQSVVIELSAGEQSGDPSEEEFAKFERYTGRDPLSLSRPDIVGLLAESGLWCALRTRPFSKVPPVASEAKALFVTAMDSNPLAPDPELIVGAASADFELGLKLLSKLTDGPTFLCVREGSRISGGDAKVQREEFSGPHPSGTVGVHIHTLYPVSRERSVWHIGYQDVIGVGRLFKTGKLDTTRIVSLAGPVVGKPRLVQGRNGASIDDLLEGEFAGREEDVRCVSGSVLSGKKAVGKIFGFVGGFANQVSVLGEGHEREFLGWLAPGKSTFSVIPLFISKLFGVRKFNFTTSTHGSARAMVPLGLYERVMPMDILPTFLLRALTVGDTERAEQLGALELDEEDLALCTFVCPGKTNYGLILRKNLQTIEEEG